MAVEKSTATSTLTIQISLAVTRSRAISIVFARYSSLKAAGFVEIINHVADGELCL